MSSFVRGTWTGESLIGKTFIYRGWNGDPLQVEVVGKGQVDDPFEVPWVHVKLPDDRVVAANIPHLETID